MVAALRAGGGLVAAWGVDLLQDGPTLDRTLYKLSQGRITVSSSIAGLPLVMLTTTGAKSGQPRTVPLIGIPDGGDIVLIASNWGGASHPAWAFYLRLHPDVTVAFYGQPAKPGTFAEKHPAPSVTLIGRRQCPFTGAMTPTNSGLGGREISDLVLTPQGG